MFNLKLTKNLYFTMEEICLNTKCKIILDTDIGNDIDDSFALALLLTINNVDVKMISTCFQETEYRAKIVAKILRELGRTDIPIAIGVDNGQKSEPSLQRFVKDFSWDNYEGVVYTDCVDAIISCIKESEENVTIISIGAATNLANVLECYPEVVNKSEIIGMYGSVRKGYKGKDKPCPEANIYVDLDSFKKIMNSDWKFTMVPLDACREFLLDGEGYQKIKSSDNELCKLVMEQYTIWQEDYHGGAVKYDINTGTSILFDIPPILYLYNKNWFKSEMLHIKSTDDKMTIERPDGKLCEVLTDIQNDGELEEFVVNQYLNHKIKRKGARKKCVD